MRAYRTYQALVLGALGLFLLMKVSDGQILLYINQRFVILVLLAGMGLVILAQVALGARPRDADDENDRHPSRAAWGLWLLALPLLVGLFLPQRPLGSGAITNRVINTGSGLGVGASHPAQIPAQMRSVLDWARLAGEGGLVEGETADLTGFVYHDPRVGEGYFLVGRFTIACCVADAVAYGVVVRWPEADALPDNRWVRVRGTVSGTDVAGRPAAQIEAESVELIPEPEQPYLFP